MRGASSYLFKYFICKTQLTSSMEPYFSLTNLALKYLLFCFFVFISMWFIDSNIYLMLRITKLLLQQYIGAGCREKWNIRVLQKDVKPVSFK